MRNKVPERLYHRARLAAKSNILGEGLIPQKPEEWKYLVPEKHRHKEIVWLKENYRPGDIIIHTKLLDRRRLRKLNLKDVRWWIYIGRIPMGATSI